MMLTRLLNTRPIIGFENDEDNFNYENILEGSYSLAKVHWKSSVRNYSAKVLESLFIGYEVTFFKHHITSYMFNLTTNGQAFVSVTDNFNKLSEPVGDSRERKIL